MELLFHYRRVGGMFFMIIDTLANLEFYKGLNEQLYKGLKFLKETDVAA